MCFADFMEVIATSLIAVLGTLLGSVVTHLFQRRTALRAERFTHNEQIRQERIDAYCAYASALSTYRRCVLDYWSAKHEARPEDDETPHELYRKGLGLRTTALETMFRAELLTHSADMENLGRRALRSVDRIHGAKTRKERDRLRKESRAVIYEFVAASRQYIPGLHNN